MTRRKDVLLAIQSLALGLFAVLLGMLFATDRGWALAFGGAATIGCFVSLLRRQRRD